MHTVDRIEIEGFRGGKKPIRLDFDEKVNFIIGRNGTGKTSLINLINAALSGDVARLKIAPFSELTIRLKPRSSQRRPIVRISKSRAADEDEKLLFSVQRKSSDPIQWRQIIVVEEPTARVLRMNLLSDLNWRTSNNSSGNELKR